MSNSVTFRKIRFCLKILLARHRILLENPRYIKTLKAIRKKKTCLIIENVLSGISYTFYFPDVRIVEQNIRDFEQNIRDF